MQQYTDRPYVICHMLTSLDGKIDGDFFSAPETLPAIQKYGELRKFYDCPATLYGTTTMAQGYAEGFVSKLPSCRTDYPREDYIAPTDVQNFIVSIDPEGSLSWSSKYIERKKRPKAHVIEVLTEQVSNDYLAYLHSFDISYIFAGTRQLDCNLLLKKLKKLFGIEKLLLAGGGLMNGTFLQENLIDELSIVLAPTTDGSRKTATLFEKAEFLPQKPPAAFRLKAVERRQPVRTWQGHSALFLNMRRSLK